jgi:hypothetical protein
MKTCLSRKILSFAVIICVLLAFGACGNTKAPAQAGAVPANAQSAQGAQTGVNNMPVTPGGSNDSTESAQGGETSIADKVTAAKPDSAVSAKGSPALKQSAGKTDTANASSGKVETQPSNDENLTIHLTIAYPKEANLSDASSNITFSEGESVLDILVRYGKENKIPVVFSGLKSGGYVEGINGVFEFDYGAESGWVYEVNGTMPKTGAGAYKPKNGDTIIWRYTYTLSGVEK